MANYLDQIPKQLAARRKAFAAARANPALLPSCWAIVRTIANNMNEYSKNAVIGGCTFPDRPIYLSPDDTGFINFGATPGLLSRDLAWINAEKDGHPIPDPDAPIPPEAEAAAGRRLAVLARTFGRNHHATRVYNLEPWLQDMYRDKLDVDYAESLQRQIDSLNAYMETVPRLVQGAGLSPKLTKGVIDAFNLFKTITGSSHQLDREKMSFVDRRSYVNTMQKIEAVMAMADQSLGSAMAGKSVIRELYGLWKDANYEMMRLTRQLRAQWAGTSLDDRIAEFAKLLGAVQRSLGRCLEESREPMPQLPVFRGDETPAGLDRATVTDAFHAVLLHDFVIGANTALSARETRRFGPLSVVFAPGAGQPRYCAEMRHTGARNEEEKPGARRQTVAERESDFDRRVRYPMNCLIVPVNAAPDTLVEDMADAWLEFVQTAFPAQFKEFLDLVKASIPDAFLPPAGGETKDLPVAHARQTLARLTAVFVRWSRSGEEPAGEDGAAAAFPAYRDLVLARLTPSGFLIPVRHRPFLELFAESGDKRRNEMWKRCLGPRHALDRQLVAINVVQKDWKSLRESLKYLPMSQTKDNSSLANGFAKTKDAGDPFAEHKASAFFRKFLTDQPDLKAALSTVESQVAIEVETLRTQSESLGRTFQYDQASATMMHQQASRIQEKRNAANRHIDQYLIGLMYALDGNNEAASVALSMCLTPSAERETDDIPPPPVPEVVGREWFEANLKPLEGKFEKRKVPGEDSLGTICYDFLYFNLGLVYLRMGRAIEARMCFRGVEESSDPARDHLVRLWAREHTARSKTV